MSDERKPVLTQRMVMHLNGGSKFSSLHYRIVADGQDTDVYYLIKETDGSPHYHYTACYLVHGEEQLDLMKPDRPDPVAWILARIAKPAALPAPEAST